MRLCASAASRALGTAVLTLASAACLSSQPIVSSGTAGASRGSDLGSFELTSELLGRHTLVPNTCDGASRQHFLGGDFLDEKAGLAVRLVVDPLGTAAVRVFSPEKPFEKSVVFRREECRVFHFSIDSTGWRVNDRDDYRLTLEIDCAGKGGDTIRGSVGAGHCH